MDTKLQSSFIPKRPIVTTQSRGGGGGLYASPLGFFSLAVLLVVGLAIIGSAAVFFYEQYLVSTRADLDQKLATERAAIDTSTLDSLMRVGNRLSVAKDLLSKHVSLSSFFEFLQANTVQRIQFTEFKYGIDPRRDSLTFNIGGVAPDYTTLVFQSDALSKHPDVQDVSFSDLNLDTKGNVVFMLKLTLDPAKFLFKDNLASISLGFPY